MTWSDRSRRAISLALAVGALVLAPQLASAKFTAARTAALSVSTASMVAPTNITGTFTCASPGSNKTISFSVTGFTDGGPVGATYVYTVIQGGVVRTTVPSSSHVLTLGASLPDDNRQTVWTLRIHSVLGNWTSADSTKTATCNKKSDNSGNL